MTSRCRARRLVPDSSLATTRGTTFGIDAFQARALAENVWRFFHELASLFAFEDHPVLAVVARSCFGPVAPQKEGGFTEPARVPVIAERVDVLSQARPELGWHQEGGRAVSGSQTSQNRRRTSGRSNARGGSLYACSTKPISIRNQPRLSERRRPVLGASHAKAAGWRMSTTGPLG